MRGAREVNAEQLSSLLWRGPPRPARGPQPELTLAHVVDAALALADESGLAAVTIRELAERLKVAPMSIYTYVPGKSELLALMLDAVYRRMERKPPRSNTWRARIAAIAEDNRRLYERHPWLADAPRSRGPKGPGESEKLAYERRAFEGMRLRAREVEDALQWVLGFVRGCASAEDPARAFRFGLERVLDGLHGAIKRLV